MFAETLAMPSEKAMAMSHQVQRYRFFVFTCRDPKSDFRLPLVDALGSHYETYYMWLKRRPVVFSREHARLVEMSLTDFFKWIGPPKTDSKINFYFNSTNTSFPGLTVLLRLLASRGVWCLDMHGLRIKRILPCRPAPQASPPLRLTP